MGRGRGGEMKMKVRGRKKREGRGGGEKEEVRRKVGHGEEEDVKKDRKKSGESGGRGEKEKKTRGRGELEQEREGVRRALCTHPGERPGEGEGATGDLLARRPGDLEPGLPYLPKARLEAKLWKLTQAYLFPYQPLTFLPFLISRFDGINTS